MSLTYDQRSELRWAFEEAYVEPERRRACRVRHKVQARLVPWRRGKPAGGEPLDVTIEDFSTTGVGLVHTQPLKEDQQYLLEVPRPEQKPIWVVLRVVRCLPMDDGTFGVGLEGIELLDPSTFESNPFTDPHCRSRKSNMPKRMKIIFLLFGIAGDFGCRVRVTRTHGCYPWAFMCAIPHA
jgi:hypothetical protein